MKKVKEKQNRKKKTTNLKEHGITLIALVITVIIILILAGVTLNTALGQNGLFQRAKLATEKYKEAEEQEKEAIEDIVKELDDIIPAEAGEKVSIPKRKGWDENKVDAVGDGEGNVIPVPKGFYYAGGSETTGFVISDAQNDDLDNKEKGNQFVWIPCTEEQYSNAKDDVIDEEWKCDDAYKDNGNMNGENTTGGTGDGKAWRDNYTDDDVKKLNEVYKETNILPTESWKNENQITKGQESIKKYGGFYIARYEAGIPDAAVFSISKAENNKYIDTQGQNLTVQWSISTTDHGRGSVADTGIIKELKPVSKRGVQAWNYITQPNSKFVAENMYKGSNSVGSYLVDSQAWNHICKNIFNAKKGETANDSKEWGNYYNNTTTDYQKLTCLWAEHKYSSNIWNIATEYKTENIKEGDYPKGQGDARIELSTGASDDFKKYNIYDMAGNMWEWTTGHNVITTNGDTKQMFVVPRGGCFLDIGVDFPIVRANGDFRLYDYDLHVGFRVVLYIE